MVKAILMTSALVVAGQFVTPPILAALKVQDDDASAFGMADAIEALVMGGTIVFGKKLLRGL